MSLISLATDLFITNIIHNPIQQADGTYSIKLKESAPESQIKEIEITRLPAKSLAIKLDDFVHKNTLLKGTNHELSRCDYVLFVEDKDKNYLYFIEMKSTKLSQDIKYQLLASKCLIEYCGKLGWEFLQDNSLAQAHPFYYVLFYCNNIQKRTTRFTPYNWASNSPENYFKKPFGKKRDKISFKELR